MANPRAGGAANAQVCAGQNNEGRLTLAKDKKKGWGRQAQRTGQEQVKAAETRSQKKKQHTGYLATVRGKGAIAGNGPAGTV